MGNFSYLVFCGVVVRDSAGSLVPPRDAVLDSEE
jgi:hypothetical protein